MIRTCRPSAACAAVLVGRLFAPAVSAEDAVPPPLTRADAWQRLREQKRLRLEPYRPGVLERQILAYEKAERPSIVRLNYKGFYPRIRSLASGSRLAPVLRFWQPDIKGSTVSLHASAAYSPTGYELYDFQAGRLPHRGVELPPPSTKGDDVYELGQLRESPLDGLILYASLRYRHQPRDAFYGLGQDTQPSDRTSFLYQDASYELVTGWQFTPRFVASARLGYVQVFTTDGEDEDFPPIGAVFDDQSAPGLARPQPDFYKLAGLLLWDARDKPFNPHRGGMVALAFTRFDDKDGSLFGFQRLAADVRGYVSLGSPQRVLAGRLLLLRDQADSGSRVPFYLQEALSNSHTLRGYPTFRFRGEKGLSLQAEYRWEPAPALELAVFVDAGRVFRPEQEIGLDGLRASGGFGLRVKTNDDVLMRFDVAWGNEGGRAYLRFGPAF
ncbi:MAG TPA: BamA/TamA family outer membrane protein [Vicinamibacteria bacterium]|nr:BamA/TamA family outer membrane protein [Vicinamibacteria bacterium]